MKHVPMSLRVRALGVLLLALAVLLPGCDVVPMLQPLIELDDRLRRADGEQVDLCVVRNGNPLCVGFRLRERI